MPLETANYISDLVTTNPANSDGLNQADDHMRLIKGVLQNTFPNASAPITNASGAGAPGNTAGSAQFPAYSFSQEPGLGFYRPTASTIGYTGIMLGAVPIGSIVMHAGPSAPANHLTCDGQAVSRTTYSALFAAIGTTWGAGDGSTTFNVPGLLSRFPRHRDNSTLASVVGTLQNPANLSHTHTASGTTSGHSNDHSHTYSGNSGGTSISLDHLHNVSGTTGAMNSNQNHSHTIPATIYQVGGGNQSGGGSFGLPVANMPTNSVNLDHTHNFSVSSGAADRSLDHYHGYSGTTSGTNANHSHTYSHTTSGGSADSGSEARPYSATLLFCIRAL